MPAKINGVEMSADTLQYLETALWSSTVSLPVSEDELDGDGCMKVNSGHPLYKISEKESFDHHFNPTDCHPDTLKRAQKDVTEWFQLLQSTDLYNLATDQQDDTSIAHDLWLTRNGHGAGYWDGDYSDDELGDTLTKMAHEVDENGVLFFE